MNCAIILKKKVHVIWTNVTGCDSENDPICEPHAVSHFPRTCLSWIKERREERYFLLMWTPRRKNKTIIMARKTKKDIKKKMQGTKRMDESTPRGIGFTCQWRWKVLNFFLYYLLSELLKWGPRRKKKKGVHSEISLRRDEASFCGEMIGSECWAETSIWRRDGAVADSSSFSIVQMFFTISSINSDSRLQMQAKPQLE